MAQMTDLNIMDTIANKGIFAPWFKKSWFSGKRETWGAWYTFLRVLFGLDLADTDLDLYRQCSGRTDKPEAGFNEAWLVCGRRAGKSFMLALIAVFLACFRDWSPYLTEGERATIAIIAADRKQSRVIFRYVTGLIQGVRILKPLIERETQESIDLSNGVTIEVGTASYKSIRGYTLCAALCDEIAFWSDEGANPDKEILAAIRPSMATLHPHGMLLCASSPYARRGALWDAHRRHFGKDGDKVLVWQAATRVMNPAVPQSVIDEAVEADPASAGAEYFAEFRTDVESFVDRGLVESLVVPDRVELPPAPGRHYFGFVDPAGGSGADSMALAIAHKEDSGQLVLDAVREIKPHFSPEDAVQEFTALLRSFNIEQVSGDAWGGLFVRQPFAPIEYRLSDLNKSAIYRDSLALINSRRVELLDNARLVSQLCGLERRTARGGRDSIDHPPGAHDDLCNAAMGALLLANADGNRIRWYAAASDGRIYSGEGISEPVATPARWPQIPDAGIDYSAPGF
jgi:hypothetical protein